MRKNKKIIILIASLAVIVLLMGSLVTAWLTDKDENDIVVNLGNLKVETKVYKGVDFNYDGILDQFEATGDELFNLQYEEVDKDSLTDTKYLYPGRKITYKAIIKNTGNIPAKVSFKIALDDDEDTQLLTKIFAYTDMKYTLGTDEVTIDDTYLYEYNDYFFKNIVLPIGETMTVDFKLSCIFYEQINSLNPTITNEDVIEVISKIQKNNGMILGINHFEITSTQEDYDLE